MLVFFFAIASFNGNQPVAPAVHGTLIHWSIAEAGFLPTAYLPSTGYRGRIGIRYDLLHFSFIAIRSRLGLGITGFEHVHQAFVENGQEGYANDYLILPVQFNFLLWPGKRGPFKLPFNSMLNGYCRIGYYSFTLDSARMIDIGVEYSPGIFLKAKAGFLGLEHRNQAVYLTLGAFLGAVHRVR